MTIDELLQQLEEAKPGFVPFQPYVCGMTRADTPTTHDDPFLRAAIHVYFGDQEGAHDQLQPMESDPLASYLHGIIHRREGDFFNANYWFHRADSVTRKIGTDPEGLTSRVGSKAEATDELTRELYEEWACLVELGLARLNGG